MGIAEELEQLGFSLRSSSTPATILDCAQSNQTWQIFKRRVQGSQFKSLLLEASGAMQNRVRNQILEQRQEQLAREQQQQRERGPQPASPHSPRSRPGTAGQGTRPKVTCTMLNETERMLLRAPNRHKSMLSAGARAHRCQRARRSTPLHTCAHSKPLAVGRECAPQASSSHRRRRAPLRRRGRPMEQRRPLAARGPARPRRTARRMRVRRARKWPSRRHARRRGGRGRCRRRPS
jgi:hypothetical protein